MFLVDAAVVIYLVFFPIYPGRQIFTHTYWKLGLFAILSLEAYRSFFGKSKSLEDMIPPEILKKKNKRNSKKE